MLGVPVADIRAAAEANWPQVENLVSAAELLICDGRGCHAAHGTVVAAVDETDDSPAARADLIRSGWSGLLAAITSGHAPLHVQSTPELPTDDLVRHRTQTPTTQARRNSGLAATTAAARKETDTIDAGTTAALTLADVDAHTQPVDAADTIDGTRRRPVIALAVDGVLNVRPRAGDDHLVGSSDRLPGYEAHDVTLPGGVVDSPVLRGNGRLDLVGTVWVNPLHGRWLRRLLHRGIELAWATTWETHANDVLAPLLDLPPLPLAVTYADDLASGRHVHRNGGSAAEWKRDVLQVRYPGRPLIWLDSRSLEHPLKRAEATLQPDIDDRHGLGLRHMSEVDAWLRSIGW